MSHTVTLRFIAGLAALLLVAVLLAAGSATDTDVFVPSRVYPTPIPLVTQ